MRTLSPAEMQLILGASADTVIELERVSVTGNRNPEYVALPEQPQPDPAGSDAPTPPDNQGGGGSLTPQACINYALAPATRIDMAFISRSEGGLRTIGYTVPGFPNSGVTFGRGVDLGQWGASDLRGFGVSESGISLMSPFFGLRGTAAVNALNTATSNGAQPVEISISDAQRMSDGVRNAIFTRSIREYDNLLPTIPFYELPTEAQTALMDLAYNAGNLARAAPTFTYYAVNGLWSAAIAELRDWNHGRPDPLQNRHREQANLLERAVNTGHLPSNGCAR